MIWDTNAVSAFLLKDPGLGAIAETLDAIVIPLVVEGEYRFGLEGSNIREETLRKFEALLHVAVRLPLDTETPLLYGRLAHQMKKCGRQLSQNDIWIAALALQHQLPVLSRDLDFDHVPGVRRVGW